MERSQSCTNFDLIDTTDSNNNNHKNKNNNNIKGNCKSIATLHKTIDLRQFQQQQQQMQLLDRTENLNGIIPLYNRSKPKRPLVRQKPTEYEDDLAYAADLEEEEDDDDDDDVDDDADDDEDDDHGVEHDINDLERTGGNRMSAAVTTTSPAKQCYPKQLKYQKQKQQSESAVFNIKNSSSSSSALSTTSSSSCSVSTSNLERRRRRLKHEESFDSSTTTTTTETTSPICRRHRFANMLMRDNSLQSDSSRYSSVDSLLEARKPDPEAILINLGFGPVGSDVLSRIPKRFLKPSQVRGIDTEAFVKRIQLASTLADQSVLGYRGLTGNPDIPPSSIVAKIMERFEVNQRKKSMGSMEHTIR